MTDVIDRPTIDAPIEVVDKTLPDILRHAALYIEEHGWLKGLYADAETGSVCTVGAIQSVVFGRPADELGFIPESEPWDRKRVYRRAVEALNWYTRERNASVAPFGIAFFNDHVARDATDVTTMLRDAATDIEALNH